MHVIAVHGHVLISLVIPQCHVTVSIGVYPDFSSTPSADNRHFCVWSVRMVSANLNSLGPARWRTPPRSVAFPALRCPGSLVRQVRSMTRRPTIDLDRPRALRRSPCSLSLYVLRALCAAEAFGDDVRAPRSLVGDVPAPIGSDQVLQLEVRNPGTGRAVDCDNAPRFLLAVPWTINTLQKSSVSCSQLPIMDRASSPCVALRPRHSSSVHPSMSLPRRHSRALLRQAPRPAPACRTPCPHLAADAPSSRSARGACARMTQSG